MATSTVKLVMSQSDIAVVPNLADYPAAVVHSSYVDGSDPSTNAIGTGPYIPQEVAVGQKVVLVRAPNHTWWGGTSPLDEIHYIDFGTDPSAMLALAGSDEIDCNYETTGDFIEQLDAIGWKKQEAVTMSTIVVRMNSGSELYKDKAVRQAIQKAVDPKVVLELGYNGLGTTAENHHAGPIHPEYAKIPAQTIDPAALKPALEAAGMADKELEIISLDDGFEAATTDAVAAQLRDAGANVKRTVMPGSIIHMDPPVHAAWRKIGSRWFTPRAAARLRSSACFAASSMARRDASASASRSLAAAVEVLAARASSSARALRALIAAVELACASFRDLISAA